ncbi:MAG TPA: PLP-dependent transferase [Steroidobacteraceae bacterium]|nr:PLP-dependent transferase [Steroidobacteraceae bacterium]
MKNQSNDDHELLSRMGLRPVINAAGYPSRLGGTRLAPPVVAAMSAAARTFVPIAEMQARASELIVELFGGEAGCVASGADACLALASAACIAGEDLAAIDRLPDTSGLRNEIVVHRAHRNSFDHALRLPGARLVEFGYLGPASGVGAYHWQMHAAFTERTAASFYVDAPMNWVIDFKSFAAISHEHGVPVIVDAAPTQLPPENFRRWLDLGADLVACAGGKYIGGPAASGFLVGRRDLVRAATIQQQDTFIHPAVYQRPLTEADAGPHEPPHQGIGRVLKVGREELAGLIAALQLCSSRDYEEERQRASALARSLTDAVNGPGHKGITAKRDDASNVVVVSFPTEQDTARAVHALQEGSPRIFAGNTRITQKEIALIPHAVTPEEAGPLQERLVNVIADIAHARG